MSSNSLTRVLFPAALISSAVFATLTVPLTVLSSEPILVEMPPLFKVEIQPVFVEENKDFAIQYVGGSIVVSVGLGLLAARSLRAHQIRKQNLLLQDRISTLLQRSHAVDVEEALEEFEEVERISQNADATWSSTPLLDIDSVNASEKSTYESFDASMNGSVEEYMEGFTPEVEWLDDQSVNRSVPYPSLSPIETGQTVLASETEDLNSSSRFRQAHHICRIFLPQRSQTVLALLVEEKYYSLYRTQKTQAESQRLIDRLKLRNLPAMMTETAEGEYAVWVWQPDAYLAEAA